MIFGRWNFWETTRIRTQVLIKCQEHPSLDIATNSIAQGNAPNQDVHIKMPVRFATKRIMVYTAVAKRKLTWLQRTLHVTNVKKKQIKM